MISVGEITAGPGRPLILIAGPCVIEDREKTMRIAEALRQIAAEACVPLIFKASYDKANRTSIDSFRGPGLEKGLKILEYVKSEMGIPVLSDVHRIHEVDAAAEVLDVIQIPAFLCRQTDLIVAVAKTGRTVNIKKGQFLAPWDMANVVEKVKAQGNHAIMITERGVQFGYNNLVVDMRAIPIMKPFGFPVIFDATHSVQLPGGAGRSSGGQREFASVLARSAVAAGADGLFVEVHPEPDTALCDGPNSLKLDALPKLLSQVTGIRRVLSS